MQVNVKGIFKKNTLVEFYPLNQQVKFYPMRKEFSLSFSFLEGLGSILNVIQLTKVLLSQTTVTLNNGPTDKVAQTLIKVFSLLVCMIVPCLKEISP